MDHADSDELSMNDAGTGEKIDTPLTQGRTPNVRSQLISLRRQHGVYSPIGQRCTNLLELTENFDKASERRLEIAGLIDRQVADLKRLLRQ